MLLVTLVVCVKAVLCMDKSIRTGSPDLGVLNTGTMGGGKRVMLDMMVPPIMPSSSESMVAIGRLSIELVALPRSSVWGILDVSNQTFKQTNH